MDRLSCSAKVRHLAGTERHKCSTAAVVQAYVLTYAQMLVSRQRSRASCLRAAYVSLLTSASLAMQSFPRQPLELLHPPGAVLKLYTLAALTRSTADGRAAVSLVSARLQPSRPSRSSPLTHAVTAVGRAHWTTGLGFCTAWERRQGTLLMLLLPGRKQHHVSARLSRRHAIRDGCTPTCTTTTDEQPCPYGLHHMTLIKPPAGTQSYHHLMLTVSQLSTGAPETAPLPGLAAARPAGPDTRPRLALRTAHTLGDDQRSLAECQPVQNADATLVLPTRLVG